MSITRHVLWKSNSAHTPVCNEYALAYGHIDVLDTLLAHGEEEAKVRRRLEAFHSAAERGDVDVVTHLLDNGVDIAEHGVSGLIGAVAGGSRLIPECHAKNDRVIQLLLARGGDVNGGAEPTLPGVWRFTPFYEAARAGNKPVVTLLRKAGAHVGLIEAAMIGDLKTVRARLDGGENPDLVDVERASALIYAAERGYSSIVHLLLERGADPCLASSSRNGTALWRAASEGHGEITRALLETVAEDAKEEDTPHRRGSRERLKIMLLGQEADFNTPHAYSNRAPLMEAANANRFLLVELLLEAGADVNYQDASGETALMCAAKQGHLEIVRLLLQAGARCNVKNTMGISVLEEAMGGGHVDVEKLLRSVGTLEGWVRLPDPSNPDSG